MSLVLLPDPLALAVHVSEWLANQISEARDTLRIALSGGSTPKAMFDVLAGPGYKGLDWSRVQLFWGDERFVPADHPDSNYGAARARLLSKISIPESNIHPIQGVGRPIDAALAYEKTLQSAYGATQLDAARPLFDITFLGLGEDGHTASLLPGQPVLEERTAWVAEVSQGRPETRITLTYPPLESSAIIAFLVTGASKREVLARARKGDTALPAGRLRPKGQLIWFADQAAGAV